MQIQNNSNKKKILDKVLIIMAIITITMAFLLISTIVLKNAEIQIFKQKGDGIKESYSATENITWDISENGDGSVVATLSDDGILTISGTGKMKDWNEHDNTEWQGMKDKVKSVIIEDGVTNVGNFAFDRCINLISIEIKNSVTNIGDFAFAHCTNLASIKIMNGLTNIGEGAFIGCTSLISIEIPNSVISIGDNGFDSCTSLESVEIPNSVTSIGEYAFFECRSLTNVEISYSVTSIGYRAFDRCTSLTSINVDEDNKEYMDDNGVLYTKNGSEIIRYPAGKKEIIYTILTGTTSIGDMAFEGATQLTSIEIPNSLMSIGWYAFERCTSLTTIEIPNSVTDIGYCAFFECTSLTNINIPNRVTVISAYIFYGCTSLNNIEISNGVTNIEGRAFMDCTSLKSINIPNSVTIIGDYAFYGCTSLTSINIPNNVTNIGVHALNKCPSLTSIDVDEDNENYMDDRGVLYTKDGSDLIKYPEGKKETIYTILMGTTSIRDYAFDGSINLTSIEIPNSVTTIEFMSFSYCTRLTTIAIPNSVTSIGVGVFDECPNLTIYCKKDSNAEQYAIDNDISYVIDDEAPTITSVIGNPTEWTKENVTLTINGAKDSAVGLAEKPYSFDGGTTWQAENTKTYTENTVGIIIKVKDKLDNIYTHEAIDITRIEKQGNTWDISENADGSVVATLSDDGTLTISGTGNMKDWSGYDNTEWHGMKEAVKSVIIENGVTSIGWYAFSKCTSLTSIEIPNSITAIGGYTFEECTSLTSVKIPNGVTRIITYTFLGCTNLTSIEIPNSVTNIDGWAFMGCTNLASIEIPNSVTNIELMAFIYCRSLTSIKIPNSVTSIGNYVFDGCTSLTSIEVAEDNKNYMDDNGVLYTKSGSEIIRYPEGKKETTYTILTGATSIRDSAFSGCTSLKTIEIPNSITSIESDRFSECTNLTSIEVDEDNKNYMDDNGVLYTYDGSEIIIYPKGKKETIYTILTGTTSIRDYAFNECTSLTNIVIPDSVISIKRGAFKGCTSLISIEVPNNVTSIGEDVFKECTSLTDIVISNGITSIGMNTFYGCTSLIRVEIPNNVTSIGEHAFSKCTSLTNIGIPDSVISIGSFAFSDCTSLTNIVIPHRVTSIGGSVFARCTGLKNAEIPNSVTSIGGFAFYGCTSLISVDIPNSVTSIGTCAFNVCASLKCVKIPNSVTSIEDYAFAECPRLTIYCKSDSYVKQYAINNNIKYVIDDEGPTITNIEENPASWTKGNVTLTINAEDSVVGLAEKPYSFDGGETWQSENTKTYTENTDGIVIKVKDKLDNIYTHDAILVLKIDKQVPIITSVTGNPTQWTNKDITLTISSEDSVAGLAEKPYSFDGGETWQAENTNTYTKNTSGIIIKVKDQAGNVATYNDTVDITKIDKVRPIITSVTGNATEWTDKDVTLRISASDISSGLDAYSFDGGETWQKENTKTYTENTSGIIIAVKDRAGNVATYAETITIDKINGLDVKLELYEAKQIENHTYITNITPETSIKEFANNIKTNGAIEIYKGTEKITNTDTKIGTGMTVKITLNEKQREYTAVIKGDINGDGNVKLSDLSKLKLSLVGTSKLEGAYKEAADINGDGNVKLSDLSKMKLYLVGKGSL